MAKKKKKTLSGLDKYVIFCFTVLIIYTITSQIIQVFTGYTNDVLTTCVYGFFGGETVTCAIIKIFKIVDLQKRALSTPMLNIEEHIEKNLP